MKEPSLPASGRPAGPRGVGHLFITGAASILLLCLANFASGAEAEAEAIAAGRAIAADRNGGNCYSCHQVEGAELAGNTGPPLVYMKMRYPDREALRNQIADPRVRNPNSIMPPYGAHGVLTEQELDQVVEYVLSL